MDLPRIRPSFEVALKAPPDRAMAIMRHRLGDDFRECTMSAGRCMDLFVEAEARTFWSPHLAVQVEEDASGSRLHGRFAPHPEVWTLFVFLYAVFVFAALIGLGWGFSQWVLGRAPWGFLLTPGALAGTLCLYLGARWGQRTTRRQMILLRERLDHLLPGLEVEPATSTGGQGEAT